MRLVVDTNVIVSGLLNPQGTPARLLDMMVDGRFVVLHDDRILSEYTVVLGRKGFGFDPDDVGALLAVIEADGECVRAAPLAVGWNDPHDAMFGEVAVAGHAEFLVTGNARHFRGFSAKYPALVIAPASFLARCGSQI